MTTWQLIAFCIDCFETAGVKKVLHKGCSVNSVRQSCMNCLLSVLFILSCVQIVTSTAFPVKCQSDRSCTFLADELNYHKKHLHMNGVNFTLPDAL